MKDCRRCMYGSGDACGLGYDFGTADDCGDYSPATSPKARARRRSPGRPPIPPNPPRTPAERVARWRAILAAFQESTGFAVGTPPTFLYMNCDGTDRAIPSIGRRDPGHDPAPPRWPGRDPALLAVLQSEAFQQAARKLPPGGPGVPTFRDLQAAAKAWRTLQATARRVVECAAEIEARHHAGKGLQDWRTDSKDARTRWASAWLPLPMYLYDAAKVLADAEIPATKPAGRPKAGTRDAMRQIVAVLSTIRCPDGRELSVPELTWLLMLALPDRFLYADEMRLRERVMKARVSVVRMKPRPKT